jgi:hypothetical protein
MSWVGLGLLLAACGGGEPPGSSMTADGSAVPGDVADAAEVGGDLAPDSGWEAGPPTCKPDTPCDDGDPCTVDDFCTAGICTGEVLDCDDGLDCTEDLCLPGGGCDHPLRPDWCFIDETCYEEGQAAPDNPCLECITAVSQEEWSADNLNACDDGDPCTSGDLCAGGLCQGKPLVCGPSGNPCSELSCVDGDCVPSPLDGPCDDASVCTLGETCIEGICTADSTLDCDDANPCTDDTCHKIAGCVHVPNQAPCDDGNACTGNDTCGGGLCLPGGLPPECDDGNPCTDDSCHPTQGCMHFPNAAPCDDLDPCFLGDFCLAGTCQPGPEPTFCDDLNACTDDACVPFAGCAFEPNTAPCDDLDPCSLDDACGGGTCLPGPGVLPCDDGNVCTADSCQPFAGCTAEPTPGLCDDANLCTADDACNVGECSGTPISCDDGNDCTADSCTPDSGCQHKTLKTAECKPKIVISYPPRGITIKGPGPVVVTGTVTSKAAPISSFAISGIQVPLAPDGSFSYGFVPGQGMNLIVTEAADQAGGTARTTPSFYFSELYYPVDAANPQGSMVQDGILIFLGPEVWDDNDVSDVDDMATIMVYYMKGLNLGALITNPVSTGNLGWCSYKINISNIKYGDPSVDLIPIDGGLHLFVSIPNFSADIQIDQSGFLCPDMNGTAKATSITIDSDVMITSTNGVVSAQMASSQVKVNGLDIQISGILGFLLNWLINFFEDSFADQIAASFQQQLGGVIPKAIVDALNSLALDQVIEIKPFMGSGQPVKLSLKTGLSSVDFKKEGAVLGMKATVVTPKVISHNPLGSIGRAACLTGQPEPFSFPMKGQLEMGLHDDFFNQLPFGMYYGGLFHMVLLPSDLGTDLTQYGLTDVILNVDFLLAPILTGCTKDGKTVLQIGDMRVDGDMKLFGAPVTMTLYASMEVEADLVPVDVPGQGKQISVALGQTRIMEVEITQVTGALAGAEDILVGLVKEQLVGKFLSSFAGGAFGSFPVPDIDLSSVNPSVPPGSKISLDLKEMLRIFGYTVLTGEVK